MFKFIINFIYFIICFLLIEYISYTKDYNEFLIVKNNIIYDIKNNNLQSFKTYKYSVCISYNENLEVFLDITYNRNSFFNIKALKKIKYHRLVN